MSARLGAAIDEAYAHATPFAIESLDHGPRHWREVGRMALEIVGRGVPADPDVLLAFAAWHDSQRLADAGDPDHGTRAVEVLGRVRGDLGMLSDDQYAQLVGAVGRHTSWHPEDGQLGDVTVAAAIAADRLTLWRVGTEPDFGMLPSLPLEPSELVGLRQLSFYATLSMSPPSWEELLGA